MNHTKPRARAHGRKPVKAHPAPPTGMTPMYYARKRKKISQRDLGELVGITAANISRVEKGAQVPSLDVAERLARFLRISELHIFYPERYKGKS